MKSLQTAPGRCRKRGQMLLLAGAWNNSRGLYSECPTETNAKPKGDIAPAPSKKYFEQRIQSEFHQDCKGTNQNLQTPQEN